MIAIIEDDNSIRELVCYTLNNTGFEAVGFFSGKEFFEFIENQLPELLLLDIMLPGEDGITILKKLRQNRATQKLPIIMLTAKSTEFDKVIGLDSGADDYISKPFGMMELISRVKAVLRRGDGAGDKAKLSYKTLVLDDTAHSVFTESGTPELTLKEYNLLKLLLQNEGRVLTRDMILQKIWDYDFGGETRTVDVHVRTLRTKLGAAGQYIETVRGVGYKIGGEK